MNSVPRRSTAVFLDRDGTIAEEVGYMNHLSRFRLLPGAAEAIRRLNQAGYPVIVVTNQSGVGRGFFPEELVQRTHARMAAELAASEAFVDAIYYCPHIAADNCRCRKPLPGMLVRASREQEVELKGSWVVSDQFADIDMAHSVGAQGILVMTGYGRGEYEWNRTNWAHIPYQVAEDLPAAVELILEGPR